MTRGIDGGVGTFSAATTGTPALVHNAKLNLYGFTVVNNTAALAYVQLFDKATTGAVTLGSTVPDAVIPVPPNGSVSRSFPEAVEFGNGLVVASTTTRNGSAGAATDILFDFWGA